MTILLAVALISFIARPAWQEPTPPALPQQHVTLVVRDASGVALPGIVIDLAQMGPPDIPDGQCATNASGECHLTLAPGAYVLTFKTAWNGQGFVDPTQQNAGPAGAEELLAIGFPIQVELSTRPEQTFLFVIGQSNGQLAPLWDMAPERSARPQPYLAPQQQGHVDLGPLSAASAAADATRQAVIGGYAPTTAATPIPLSTSPAPSPQDDFFCGLFLPALAGLIVLGVLVVAGLIIRRRRKAARRTKPGGR